MSGKTSYALPDIIGQNYDKLARKQLNQLLLPGTHNSGAYQLLPPSAQLDGPCWQAPLCCLLQTVAKPLSAHWALTQDLQIYEQLMMGIRFFDLRISAGKARQHKCTSEQQQANCSSQCYSSPPSPVTAKRQTLKAETFALMQGLQQSLQPELPAAPHRVHAALQFYVTHGLPCVEFQVVLLQLRAFLLAHKSEIVVIRLCADWDHREYLAEAQGDEALAQVESIIGDMLYNHTAMHQKSQQGLEQQEQQQQQQQRQGVGRQPQLLLPTLEQMVAAKQRVALFVELPCSRDGSCPNMFIRAGLEPLWANSPTPKGTVAGLLDAINMRHATKETQPCFAAMAATPDVATICCGVASSIVGIPADLRTIAAETNALLPRLLAEDLSGLMAVTVDFPTEEVVRQIMDTNLT